MVGDNVAIADTCHARFSSYRVAVKRTAWVFARLFLRLHSQTISFTPREAIDTVLALAAGDLTEAELADWFRAHIAAG